MIEIIQAKNQDIATIKQLMLFALQTDPTAFTVSFDEYNSESDFWWNNYLSMYVGSKYGAMYLAKIDSTPAGMVGVLYNKRLRQSHASTIVWLYVKPEFRKMKLATKLMEYVICEITKDKTIKKISLTVTEKQIAAISLYKNLGFSVTGIQKDELKIEDEYIDFLMMEKIV